MATIEITTTGEVIKNGETVGQIDFTKPFAESDVAGVYYSEDDEDLCDMFWEGAGE